MRNRTGTFQEQNPSDPENPHHSTGHTGSLKLAKVDLSDVKAKTVIGTQKIHRDKTESGNEYDHQITFNQDGTKIELKNAACFLDRLHF